MGRESKKQTISIFHGTALHIARESEDYLIERGKEIEEAVKRVLAKIEFPSPELVSEARELFKGVDLLQLESKFYSREDKKTSYRRRISRRLFRIG